MIISHLIENTKRAQPVTRVLMMILGLFFSLVFFQTEAKAQCAGIDSVRFTNVTCFGTATGTVTVYASTGTPPYTYLLQRLTGTGFVLAGTSFGNPSTTHTFTGLVAGNNYFVTVADDDPGCSAVISAFFNITQPPNLVLTLSSRINVNGCFGDSTGSITVTATGGTAPYQYSINGGAFGPSNTFSNLAAGSYTLTVRDQNNCTRNLPVNITQPTAVNLSISAQSNISCFNAATGSFSVSTTGGALPYAYSLNGAAFAPTSTFNNLAAGNYTVIVRDSAGCRDTVMATITQPLSGVTLSLDSTRNISCNGAADGRLILSASNGAVPYQFSLNGGAFGPSGSFTGLAPGTYTIIVRDNGNCTDTLQATLSQPPVLDLSTTSVVDNLCFGDNSGAINLAATGGTPAYTYALNAGAFGPGNSFTALGSGSYVARVRDANGCTDTLVVNINPPADLQVITGAVVNVACFGQNSGSFSVTGLGGTAPYQFAFQSGAFSATNSFSGLAAGSYRIRIRDSNLCQDSIFVNITQPASALDISVSTQVNPNCFGANNGSIQVNASGGTAPYQFSINGGAFAAGGNFTGLIAGNYLIRTRDANNCTDSVSVTLSQPTLLDISISSQTNVACFGESNGSVQLSGTGGTAAYSFALNAGPFQASGSFTGLAAGSYTARIQDVNGCADTLVFSITAPPALNLASGPVTQVACFGSATGAFSVVASGGQSPYSYSINGSPFGPTLSFTSLTAGLYNVIVRDANLCSDTVSVNITQPASALDISISSQTNVSCFGSGTGSLSVSGSGGTAPYQYSINGGAFSAITVYNGLAAGSYTLRVRDANLCLDSVIATITQPATALDIAITTQSNLTCNGAGNGSITANASGGVGPYTYSLNGGAFQPTGVFNSLSAGTFQLIARDANGCQDTVMAIITQPAVLDLSLSSQINNLCFGESNGSITLAATGGTGPYQYALGGSGFGASAGFTGLAAGSYMARVRDAQLCTDSLLVTITQPSDLNVTAGTITPVSCFGSATGAFTVSGSGGTSPYQFSFNGGAFASFTSFSGLVTGNYRVVIRDANNCRDSVQVTISQPASALDISLSSQTNPSCNGSTNGSLSVAGSGGTSPYLFSLNGGTFIASGNFTGLSAGNYSIVVRDANNCTDTVQAVLSQPAAIDVQVLSQTNNLCFNDNTGSITLTASGGTLPYTFALNSGAFGPSAVFNSLTSGSYIGRVQDTNGCRDSISITLTAPPAIVASIASQTNVACFGEAGGSLTVSATGGQAPYSYSLNGAAFSGTSAFSSLSAGLYQVIVRDANNCTDTVSATITQPASAVSLSLTSKTDVACFGQNTGSINVNATGGVSPFSFSINGAAFQPLSVFSSLTSGTYSIVVRDANSCRDTLEVTILQPSTPLAISLVSQTQVLCFGDSTGTFTVAAAGGTAPYQFSVNGGAFSSVTTYTNRPAGNYSVVLRDANGCTDTLDINITQPGLALNISIGTQVNVTCSGGNSGLLNLSGNGGTAPYQFSINGGTFQSSGTFAGLSAGTYNLAIRDANNCISGATAIITEPSSLNLSIASQVNVACFGASTGSINASASGGTAPYQYSFNGSAFGASSSFTGLSSGTYNLVLRDANNCQVSQTVNITQPASALSLSVASQTNVLCNGASTGAVTLSALGGTAPYTYSVDGVNFVPGATFTALSFGAYTFRVRDANNCLSTVNVNISQPASAVTFSAIGINPSSCTSSDGQIVISGTTGGTAPYSYSIDGTSFGPVSTFTGLGNGTYFVFVRDANNCTVNTTVSISSPGTLSALATADSVDCFGGNDGSISLSGLSGGNGNYSFSLNGGPFQTSAVFAGLTSGLYTVAVRDNPVSCTINLNVQVNQPLDLTIALVSQTNNTCRGGQEGVIQVNGNGGTSPYSYSINGSSFSTSSMFDSLPAGNYVIRIRDSRACVDSLAVSISQPASGVSLAVSSVQQLSCQGDSTGAITVAASGGTSPYSFSINGGPFAASNSFSQLTAGNYTLTVRDVNGCDTSLNVSISAPSPLLLNVVATTQVTCFGGGNGRIEVAAFGGTAPYTYSINASAFASVSVFNGLTAANYQIRVRDANNCEAIQNVSISQPAALAFLVNANVNPGCFGESVWSVSFSPFGGTAPYTFRFLDTAFSAQTSFTSVLPGFYFVTIRDSNACELTSPLILPNPYTQININVVGTTQVICHGDSSGSISVNASGGVGGYQFSINGGIFQPSGMFTQLPAGTYNLAARDSFGCTAQTVVNINQPLAPVSFDVVFSNPSTCSSNDGSISLINLNGGVSPYSYSLGGGTYVAGSTFNGLGNGSYLLFVRDANSCTTAADTVILSSPGGLSATISSSNVSCFGGNNGSVSVSAVAGGNGNFQYSLNGGPFGGSSSFTGLTAGVYTVVVRDSPFTCEITFNANITQPDSLNLSINTTDVLCFGEPSGQLNASATGGIGPYTFSLNAGPFLSVPSFNGLAAGTYTLALRDANSCEVQQVVLINQPGSALNATIASISQVACFGDSSGSLSISASGGSAPYMYSLHGGPFVASNTFNGLAAGNYTLTVRDSNNCDTTVNFSITAPAQALSLSVGSVSRVNCFGDTNGSVSLAASGGTAPYQFAFNGSSFGSLTTFGSLTAGTYVAIVRDANACTDTLVVLVPGPTAPINYSVTSVSPSSCSVNDGSISFTGLSGGTAPYLFSIDGGSSFVASSGFTGLGNGTYFLQVRDSNACSNGQVAILNGPGAITATANVSQVTCNGTATGTINISGVSGGNGNYQYSINGGTFQTSPNFTGLTAGAYLIQVRDQPVSCTITLNATLTQPSALSTNVLQQVNPSCTGAANGRLEIQAIGGTPGYRYSVNGGTFQSSGLFNSLTAGNYTIVVRDSNACETTLSRSLTAPSGLVLTASTITPVTCFGDSSAQVSLSTSGGTAPYTFSSNGITFQTSPVFSSLASGSYMFVVRDSNLCTSTLALTISQPATPLQLAASVSAQVLCFGANSGAITASGLGGTAPYEFRLNGGSFVPNGNFSSLPAGTYLLTVRDASGCVADSSLTISGPGSGVVFTSLGLNPASCSVNNGSVRVASISGGVPPYQYSLGGVSYQSDSNFTGLTSGTYALFARDANGCVAGPDLVSIAAPGGLSAQVTSNNPTCFGQANGQIRIRNISGGSGQYRFSLNGSAPSTDSTFNNLVAGSYTLVVTDTPASCSSTFNVILVNPDSISITLVAQQNARCTGDSSGSFSVLANGGRAPYSYALNGGSAQVSGSFSGLAAGVYLVTVTDSLGCTQNLNISIQNQPASGAVSLASLLRPSCLGASDGALSYTVTGTATPYQFSLNGSAYSSQSSFNGLSAGMFILTVMDSNNCLLGRTDILSQPDSISIFPQISNAVGCGSSSGRVVVNASGGTAPYRYSLNGGPLVSNDTFNALAPGFYTVQVVDSLNCSNTRSFVINATGTISGTVFQTPVLCNGVANGQALVFNVTGGSGNYQYSINGTSFQTSPLFSSLALGPYLVYVRDANDTLCVSTFPITVAAQFTVSGLVVVTGSSCTAADGQIEFSISGGTAPYQYSVDSGLSFVAGNIFTGLAAGTYHLVVRDANNCTFNRTVVLPGAPVIQPFASVISQVTCAGQPNGVVRVDSVSGSVGPFLYSIDGVNFVSSNVFTGLSADTLVLRVQDIGSGCIATDTLLINGPALLEIQAQVLSQAGCAGASNGLISVQAVGGIGSYQYRINNEVWSSDTLFSGLAAGSYTLWVSDSLNCTDSVVLTLNPSDTLQVQFTSSGASTCNTNDAFIQIQSVSGGTAPYRFAINGGAASGQTLFNGLAAGNYQLTVLDTNNCSRNYSLVLPSGSGLAAQANSQRTSCRGTSTGSIRVTQFSGGLAPYQFSLDSVNFQPDSVFTGLTAGNYRVVVRSADSCQVILQVAIQDADSLVAAVNFVKDVSCREANDGILDLNASGGTPGYRFSLDGVSYVSSDLFIGLSPRVDTAFVQDSAGCIVEVPFIIGQPDSVGYVVTVTPANTCNAATGTAVISNITGGQAPYQLSINGGSTFSDTTTFAGLTNGNYTLIIRDSVGCLYTSQFTIAVPGGLQLGISQMIQPTCFGSNNGEIRIGNITGGARPYQFSIDGGLSFGNDSVLTNLISFVYTVVIRDANNCTYTYIYNLGQPSNINFNVNQQQPATCDSSNGSVIVTNVVGGITPYSYRIDYNGSTFQPSPIFTGIPGGNYQVTVQDATGLCEVTKLVVVAGNPGITFDFEVTDALCFGGNDGELKLFNIQGGLPPYRAGLDTSQNYLVVDQTNSVTFSNLLPGSYNYQIRDEDGCTYKLPPIEVGAPDSIGFMVRNVQLSRRDSAEGILYVFDINGGAEPYRYSIDGINYLPFEYSLSTFEYTAMIKNLRVGNYTVFVQDTNGCTNAARVSVQPYQFASRFEIPNVFTPNGDGFNETFVINRLPSNSKLKIFARNGRLVYSSEDYTNDWDGEGWPNGVYFYSMTIPNLGDFAGWVEIKR